MFYLNNNNIKWNDKLWQNNQNEIIQALNNQSLQKLNAKYKSGKDKIESRIAQSIDKSNPERIAQNLITRNSADTLATVKEMIGPKRFIEVSKAFLRTHRYFSRWSYVTVEQIADVSVGNPIPV